MVGNQVCGPPQPFERGLSQRLERFAERGFGEPIGEAEQLRSEVEQGRAPGFDGGEDQARRPLHAPKAYGLQRGARSCQAQ